MRAFVEFCVLTGAISGALALKGAEMQRAEDIFTSGPETLVAQSEVIATGPVVNFEKKVIETHAPSGTPLRWRINGEIVQPEIVKGTRSPSPIFFSRTEQAVFLDQQPEPPRWASDYLLWEPGDRAVIFFLPGEMQVFPSGEGQRDLAAAVRRIVAIQTLDNPEDRLAAWARLANSNSATMLEKQAALRSLVALRAPFSKLSPLFQHVLGSPSGQMRSFAFALVVFGISHQRWSDLSGPTELLCQHLQAETDVDSVYDYIASFGSLLSFANQHLSAGERLSMMDHVRACLSQKCDRSSGRAVQACREILSRFPQ